MLVPEKKKGGDIYRPGNLNIPNIGWMSKRAVRTRILFRRKTREPRKDKKKWEKKFRNARQNMLVFFV